MTEKPKLRSVALFVFITTLSPCFAAGIGDIIQPVNVTTGKPDTVLISDMFYSPSYANIAFQPNPGVDLVHDTMHNTILPRPKNNFTGGTLVDFTLGSTEYSFPVMVSGGSSARHLHTFTYTTGEKVSNVFVSGSFNNWEKTRDRLVDSTGRGIFSLSLPLDPGNYNYKFIVDGREILDPANPEKSPTGFDDFTSILRIAETDTGRIFLHAGRRAVRGSIVSFSFYYENTPDPSPLQQEDLFALLNNTRIAASIGNGFPGEIVIAIPSVRLGGDNVLRVFVSHGGKATNIQQVVLHNGFPAGSGRSPWSWYDGEIYSIMIDRFNDGDRSNDKPVVYDSIFFQANYQGGDFTGIRKKIEEGYFNALGVNTLWISPVYDNPDIAYRESPPPYRWYSGYHGYWPISDTAVEEKFGTMNDLRRLIAAAHRHGLKVLLDIVAHHVHSEHPWYKEHPDWFGTLDLPDGRKNIRLWDEQRLTTWFEPYMPSFDFTKSSAALEAISDNAIWWLKTTGADGFRHDAVKHVPNSFWRTLTRKLKERIELPLHKEVYQIGETFGDYDLVASYVNNGQLSAQFNFNLSYYAIPVFLEPGRSFSFLDSHMKKSFASFGQNNLMGNIMDSHDKIRYMAYADGKVTNQGTDAREMAWKDPPTVDHPSSYRKAELYLAYMFTIPGLPVIYYGSEFGMTGADDPDNRRMMRFGSRLSIYEKRMLDVTKKIVHLRNEHPALRYGDFLTLKADTAFYAYLRSDMNERILVILNKSEQPRRIDISIPKIYAARELVDCISGERTRVENAGITLDIPPIGWRVFTLK